MKDKVGNVTTAIDDTQNTITAVGAEMQSVREDVQGSLKRMKNVTEDLFQVSKMEKDQMDAFETIFEDIDNAVSAMSKNLGNETDVTREEMHGQLSDMESRLQILVQSTLAPLSHTIETFMRSPRKRTEEKKHLVYDPV